MVTLPIGTGDLLLNAINIVLFYIIQVTFFKFIGSKTNLNVTKEVLNSVRNMVLTLTYNKIDINEYINLTQEERSKLEYIKENRNNYNDTILNPLYKLIAGAIGSIAVLFFILPDTDKPGSYLRNTFLTTTNITLILMTLGLYSTEFYLYFRFISRMQLVTALDFLEDPTLYEKNLTKFQDYSLYDIYNDNEIQIIHEINKYITKPNKLINKKMFIDEALKKMQSDIENDVNIQQLISEKAKLSTRVDLLKKIQNYYNLILMNLLLIFQKI